MSGGPTGENLQQPAAQGDFNRIAKPPTADACVAFVTTYSRMMATVEQTDAMLDRAYGKGRHPGYEGRRWDRKPKKVCEQCGKALGHGRRFCSQQCWAAWRIDQQPEPPTHDEQIAEMQAALDELRAYVEEREG